MDKLVNARSSYWDNLKGILILLVVCGHLCERYINDSDLLKHIWIIIYSFHMPMFIFLNGYFARKSSKSPVQKSLKMLKYYLLMQILFVFGNCLILREKLELSVLASPAYCCWYLLFLVYAYLITNFLPQKSSQLIKWIAVSIFLSLLVGFDVSVGHTYAVGRTFYFLPYFLIGALWADTGKAFKSSKEKKIICAVSAVVIFFALWSLGSTEWFNRSIFSGHKSYEALYPEHILFAFFNKMAVYIISIVLAYIILNLIPHRKTIFCFIGRHTLLIYLVHIFVFPMEFYLIKDIRFVGIKELNSAIILLILAASVAIICYILFVLYRFVILNLINSIRAGKFMKGE